MTQTQKEYYISRYQKAESRLAEFSRKARALGHLERDKSLDAIQEEMGEPVEFEGDSVKQIFDLYDNLQHQNTALLAENTSLKRQLQTEQLLKESKVADIEPASNSRAVLEKLQQTRSENEVAFEGVKTSLEEEKKVRLYLERELQLKQQELKDAFLRLEASHLLVSYLRKHLDHRIIQGSGGGKSQGDTKKVTSNDVAAKGDQYKELKTILYDFDRHEAWMRTFKSEYNILLQYSREQESFSQRLKEGLKMVLDEKVALEHALVKMKERCALLEGHRDKSQLEAYQEALELSGERNRFLGLESENESLKNELFSLEGIRGSHERLLEENALLRDQLEEEQHLKARENRIEQEGILKKRERQLASLEKQLTSVEKQLAQSKNVETQYQKALSKIESLERQMRMTQEETNLQRREIERLEELVDRMQEILDFTEGNITSGSTAHVRKGHNLEVESTAGVNSVDNTADTIEGTFDGAFSPFSSTLLQDGRPGEVDGGSSFTLEQGSTEKDIIERSSNEGNPSVMADRESIVRLLSQVQHNTADIITDSLLLRQQNLENTLDKPLETSNNSKRHSGGYLTVPQIDLMLKDNERMKDLVRYLKGTPKESSLLISSNTTSPYKDQITY